MSERHELHKDERPPGYSQISTSDFSVAAKKAPTIVPQPPLPGLQISSESVAVIDPDDEVSQIHSISSGSQGPV